MKSSVVYLNGRFVPAAEAQISVMDRGFLFGDGVYEVIPSVAGRPAFLDRHLRRLDGNLEALGIDYRSDTSDWAGILARLAREHGGGYRGLYVQVTRGVQAVRAHVSDAHLSPTLFAMALEECTVAASAQGRSAITLPDTRWHHCGIKATTLLASVLYRREAVQRGAEEALLVRDGMLTEGAASNVFVVHEGHVCTPPLGNILPGITRAVLLDVLRAQRIDCREVPIPVSQLVDADEIWVTASTQGVTPVTRLDGRPVGTGQPGPLWRRALDAYRVRLHAQLQDPAPGDDALAG